jgi:8-oxo-dGTP pyrophosphatase MutT (NUDIX family)
MPVPVKPLPSASIMLIRDGQLREEGGSRIEILMMERHGKMRFAAGALVFPGGKVDRVDSDPTLFNGFESLKHLPYRFAAIREMFEEAGVLLARRHKAKRPLGKRGQIALSRQYRRRFLKGNFSLADLRRRANLRFSPDQLVPFAHWVTPDWQPMRFSTVFFLAALPAGQVALHDGGEAVHSFWARPADILGEDGLGPKNMMFPTRLNLAKLAKAKNVREALDRARKSKIVTVIPRVVRGEKVATAYIPQAAGYGGGEFQF